MALSRGCSLPVDFATLHPSGCLRQSFSLRSIMSPYGLPSAGSVGSHSPEMSHPSGCLCSLPRNRPVAWFPASARWHVFSAALRLPPSLPLMSPFGLPAAGYPASARWHVFAPAHVALRAAFGRLPSQRPLACVPVSGFKFPPLPFTRILNDPQYPT
mgnify:CR=1 FL=1